MAEDSDDLFGDDKFAKAAAEGRLLVGMTEEQARLARRVKAASWRAANLERSREIIRESMRRATAAKAIAEGREPGRVGRPSVFSAEEQRAKRKAKTEAYNAAHLEETRRAARERGQAKRDGTFVSQALPRLTDEERRLTNIAMSAIRRTRVKENGGTFSRQDVAELRVLQNGVCLFCGDLFGEEPLHVDHWIPVIKGGSSDPDNLALLHQSCNTKKGGHMPSHFGLPDSLLQLRQMLTEPPDDIPPD